MQLQALPDGPHAGFLTRLWAAPSSQSVVTAVCEATVLDGRPVADLVGSRRAFLPDDLPSAAAVDEVTEVAGRLAAGPPLSQVSRQLEAGAAGVLAAAGPVTIAAVLSADDPDVLLLAGVGTGLWRLLIPTVAGPVPAPIAAGRRLAARLRTG